MTTAPRFTPYLKWTDPSGMMTSEAQRILRDLIKRVFEELVVDAINNGVTDTAPSQNAVFDALALKQDAILSGSFTPVAEGASSAGTGTYTDQTGLYTKIGNLVAFNIRIGWSAHTGTGNLLISGLPFALAASPANQFFTIGYSSLTYTSHPQVSADAGTTVLEIRQAASGGSIAAIAMDTSVTLAITGTYRSA